MVYLIWSTAASASLWVMKEIKYAIELGKAHDDLPEIIPVIIEGPPPAKPPEELKFFAFQR